jgi:hypothetical protein
MADEIVIKYSADVKNLEKSLHGIEDEMKDVQKASVSTGNTIQKEANESAKALNKVDKSTRGLKDSFQNLSNHLPFAGAIQQAQDLSQAFTGVTGSVGKTTGALNILKTAFASLGLGAIVVAFGSLVAYFTSTEKGGDRLAKIMAVLGATFGEVVKKLSQLGEFLFDTAESFVNYISITDRAATSTDDYSKSVSELAGEIADLEDEIGALNITMDIQNAKLQAAIVVNLKALRNRNNTLSETNDLIFEVAKNSTEQLQNNNTLLDKELEKERKIFLQKTQDFGADKQRIEELMHLAQVGNETGKQYAKEELKRFDDIIKKNAEKGKLFDQFTRSEITAGELLDRAKGTFAEEDAKRIGALIIRRLQAGEAFDALEQKLEALDAAAQAKEEARILASTKKITEIKKQAHVADIEIAHKTEFESTKGTKEESDKRHAIRVEEMKKFSKDVLQPIIDDSRAAEEAQTAKLAEEQAKRKAMLQQGVMDAIGLTGQLLEGLNDLHLSRETAGIEIERAATETRMANELDALERRNELGLMNQEQYNREKARIELKAKKKESDLKKKQWEADQKAALTRIAIETAVSVAKTAATVGYPAAIPLIAVALAQGAIQASLVRAQPVPQFKDGVIDLQGKGTGTSDSISARLSRGESVMTAKETKQYKPLFESIRNGYFDKYANENFVNPALKKEFEKNKLKEDRDKQAHEYMKSMVMNGLLDTSHLERLTKKNKSVKIENTKELIEGISNIVGSKQRRGL